MLKKSSRILTKLQRSNLIIFLVNTLKLSSSSISLNYIFKYLQYLFKKNTQKAKLLCGINVWNLCITSKNSKVLYVGKREQHFCNLKRRSAHMDRIAQSIDFAYTLVRDRYVNTVGIRQTI